MYKQSSANINLILMIATMAIVFTLVGTVHAIPMLDQEQTEITLGFNIWPDTIEYQQGLTSGRAGKLTSVEVFIELDGTGTFEFLFGLNFFDEFGDSGWQYDTNDFQTTWKIDRSGWNSLDVSSENIYLNEGTTFNFVLNGIHDDSADCDDCSIGLWINRDDASYGGGTLMSRWLAPDLKDPENRGVDLAFRTYVDEDYVAHPVPEPSTIFLIGAGLAGMFVFRKKILKSV